jgi:hypothetical protein
VHTHNNGVHRVHTHNKVHAVCTHIIMTCVVCTVLVERRVWLVGAQYEYMLSCDSSVNGARRVLLRGGAY